MSKNTYAKIKNVGLEPKEPTNILNIENLEHRKSIINNFKIVVIVYYTNWCRPCKEIKEQYSIMYKEYQKIRSFIIFVKEDMEKNIGEYIVTPDGVPCFHFYLNGIIQKDLSVIGGDLNQVQQNIDFILDNY